MKKGVDVKQDGLIEQRAIGMEKPKGVHPKAALYLLLVPHVGKTSFSMSFLADREALGVGTDESVEVLCEPKPVREDRHANPTDIYIEHDGYVVIELAKNFEWRWSATFAGIVTKSDCYADLYGQLYYAEELAGPYRPAEKWPASTELRFLRFMAKFNTKACETDAHAKQPFCLNLEFRTSQCPSGWLPITLDPRFNNPASAHL